MMSTAKSSIQNVSTNKVSNIYTISTRRPSINSNKISLAKPTIVFSSSEISFDNFDIKKGLRQVFNSSFRCNGDEFGDDFDDYLGILSEIKVIQVENCLLKYEIRNRQLESSASTTESLRHRNSKVSFQTQLSNSIRTHLSSRMSISYYSTVYETSLKLDISQKLRVAEKVKSFLIDSIQDQQSQREDELSLSEVTMSYYDEELSRLKLRTKLLNTRPNLGTIYTKPVNDSERRNQILIITRSNDLYRKRLSIMRKGLRKEGNHEQPCSVFEYQQLKYDTLKLRETYIQKQELVKSYKTLLYKIDKATWAFRKRIEHEQSKQRSSFTDTVAYSRTKAF